MPDPETPKAVVRQVNGLAGPIGTAAAGTEAATTVIAMPWWQISIVRVARVFLYTFSGVLTADGLGKVKLAGAGDLWHHLTQAALVASVPALFAFLHECIEVLTSFDVRYPQFRG